MLLTSVVIVLREVLEAALLISVLAALRQMQGGRGRGLLWGLIAGLMASLLVARSMGAISEMADGVGQELFLAGLHGVVYVTLLVIGALSMRESASGSALMGGLMALVVAVALSREGGEIYLYISAFQQQDELRGSLYSGSLVGLGMGLSVGVLLYYGLCSLPPRWAYRAMRVLLTVVAGAMALQAAGLLIQADWLPDGTVWDSSGWLPEDGVAGQLLYALLGYEATPAPAQLTIYGAGLALMAAVLYWQWRRQERAR
ncbi:FTR1 family protein [Spongiibacter tropicus]|uniref:FTR1 family protein n=1 Tax=Spongiibacter tropicus TaxID=454602 RepID=UPI0003B45BE0|nr:FTR1 family protein [Spongiibacter tropicus]